MLFNSRSVAFLLSSLITFITTFVLALYEETSYYTLLGVGITCFLSSFFLVFILFETLVFKEFRKITRVFKKYTSKESLTQYSEHLPVKNISTELMSFADMKEQEILKLKKMETFRREFLADVSHELKTPVFAAQGFIYTLLDGAVDDERYRDRFLNKAAKSLDHLTNLIRDLLEISQLETGEIQMRPESFDLRELITEIQELVEGKAQKRNTSIKVEFPDNNIILFADRYRIGQVIKNLMDNAINYGYENGNTTVSVKENKNDFQISVSDDGPGISLDHQKRIFERFYRIEKSRSKEMGGTGLGLAIVKHILEAHESNIQLNSKPGKGTTFAFKLKKKPNGK